MVCAGKHIVPYTREGVKIANKTFTPLRCDNCDEIAERVMISNNGVQLEFNLTYSDVNKIPTLSNGPLQGKGKYRLYGINFNWIINTPDEWSWNDVGFPGELHITFYNTKYRNFESAVEKNEGITILSMTFRVSGRGFLPF